MSPLLVRRYWSRDRHVLRGRRAVVPTVSRGAAPHASARLWSWIITTKMIPILLANKTTDPLDALGGLLDDPCLWSVAFFWVRSSPSDLAQCPYRRYPFRKGTSCKDTPVTRRSAILRSPVGHLAANDARYLVLVHAITERQLVTVQGRHLFSGRLLPEDQLLKRPPIILFPGNAFPLLSVLVTNLEAVVPSLRCPNELSLAPTREPCPVGRSLLSTSLYCNHDPRGQRAPGCLPSL